VAPHSNKGLLLVPDHQRQEEEEEEEGLILLLPLQEQGGHSRPLSTTVGNHRLMSYHQVRGEEEGEREA